MADVSKVIVRVERLTPWSLALDLARATMGKDEPEKEPSSQWKTTMLKCRHSPIRSVIFHIHIENLPSWVSVHFVRHKIGIEHYVRSQRTDRTGVDRDKLPQDSFVTHDMIVNADEILSISERRLCAKASPETLIVWSKVRDELRNIGEVELYNACRPYCVTHGGCCEPKTCGYYDSMFKKGA